MAMPVIRRIPPNLRCERVFRGHHNPLDSMDDDELYDAFHFHHHELLIICDELADLIGLCDVQCKGSLPLIMH